MQQELIKNK